MTRAELKSIILECIDEKSEEITEKIIEKITLINNDVFLEDNMLNTKEDIKELRKDVDYIANKVNIYNQLPSSVLPF